MAQRTAAAKGAGVTRRIAQTKQLPLSELSFYPANPRRGDIAAIRESLERTGQYRAIVVRADTREVLAGNHTLAAMRELGWSRALVHLVDVDDEAARRIVLADNRTAELASYDEQALADLLAEMDDLEGTGWDQGAVDGLLHSLNGDGEGKDTDPGDPPAEPKTKPGDLYLLGEHRLLCGDSTVEADVERLMGGGVADMLATDPPYGVAYQTKLSVEEAAARHRRTDGLEVSNDALTPAATRQLWTSALAAIGLKPGGVIYATVPSGSMLPQFIEGLDEGLGAGTFRHSLVWVKDIFVMGRADYHYRHETILYGWRGGAAHFFAKDRTQDSVWEVPRPRRSEQHPTMKPVELVERMVGGSSRTGEIVADPFAGSGSTLIACENLSRRCYAMEIDPGYCDVIVDRWERHTGRKATCEKAG